MATEGTCANGGQCHCEDFDPLKGTNAFSNCHCANDITIECDPKADANSNYNPDNHNSTDFARGCTADLPKRGAKNEEGTVTLPTGHSFTGVVTQYGAFDSLALTDKEGCTTDCTSDSAVPMLQASGGFMVLPALLNDQERPTILSDSADKCPNWDDALSGTLVKANYIVSAWARTTSYVLDSRQVVMGESAIDYTNPLDVYLRNRKRLNLAGQDLGPGQRWDPLESTCRHASLSIL